MQMQSRRGRKVGAAALSLALFAVGCGGAPSDTTAAPPEALAEVATDAQDQTSTTEGSTAVANDAEEQTSTTESVAATTAEVEAAGPGLPLLVADTVSGSQLDTSDFAGQDLVVWFWAPWCVRCRAEAPTVVEVHNQFGDEVTFLGLPSRSNDISSMERFVNDAGVGGFEHLIDANSAVWRELEVWDQPAWAFVNDDGTVDVNVGALDSDELSSRIEELLAS